MSKQKSASSSSSASDRGEAEVNTGDAGADHDWANSDASDGVAAEAKKEDSRGEEGDKGEEGEGEEGADREDREGEGVVREVGGEEGEKVGAVTRRREEVDR